MTRDGQWTTLNREIGGGASSGYALYAKGLSVARDGRVACLLGDRARTDEVALLSADGGSRRC